MKRRFANDKDGLERKTIRIFAFLRNDDRSKAVECGDLPVDVQHLWLEERRAIAGNNRPREFGHAPRCYAQADASTGQNRSLVSERTRMTRQTGRFPLVCRDLAGRESHVRGRFHSAPVLLDSRAAQDDRFESRFAPRLPSERAAPLGADAASVVAFAPDCWRWR